jgi:predicted nucleotidyltransferase
MSEIRRGPTLFDLRRRRNEILRIAARHGARNVRVFGSVARGTARPESDLDLLIELDADRGVLDLSELILDLQDALGYPVDVVESQSRTDAVRRLDQDAVLL